MSNKPITLAHLSEITFKMTPDEQKRWEVAVREAAPVLEKIGEYLQSRLEKTDVNMQLDSVLKAGTDVTMTLLALQAERDALNAVLKLFKPVD